MKTRNDRNPYNPRLFAGMLAAMAVVSNAACLTPELVSTDDTIAPVTQARAKRDLGIDYLSGRRTAMAIRELRASMRLDSSDPQTHLWLGESYRRKGRTEEAEAFLLDAIRLSEPEQDSRTTQG